MELVQEVIREGSVEIIRKFPFPLVESKNTLPRFGGRYKPRHGLASSSDDNLLTRFDLLQKLRQPGLGFVNVYSLHARRIAN